MAISGPRYLVVETAFLDDGRWTRDLVSKPNCYLSEDLAAARAQELADDAVRLGRDRIFQVQRSLGGAVLAREGAQVQAAA